MKNGITKRLVLLIIVAIVMAILLSLSGNTSINSVATSSEAGVTSVTNDAANIIPVTIVPESALRYVGDK